MASGAMGDAYGFKNNTTPVVPFTLLYFGHDLIVAKLSFLAGRALYRGDSCLIGTRRHQVLKGCFSISVEKETEKVLIVPV